jgi:hypothetical protein
VQLLTSSPSPAIAVQETETDKELALAKLALNQTDLVIVVPSNAMETVQSNQQAQFIIYHNEVDPFQVAYINSVARIYVDEVNRGLLESVTEQGQANAGTIQENLESALTKVEPPDPPAGTPRLDETTIGKDASLRQQLEAHRANTTCAACHSRMDPLGFGLENFDAIGRWRDEEEGAPVDASGVLPNGQAFSGPVELKKILLGRRDDFVRTMAENMLIYAMGRGLQLEDECVIRDVQKAAAAGEYRFSTLVLTIVKSHPFRHRKNPDF